MAKRLLSLVLLVVWVASLFWRPYVTLADNWPELVVDQDGDGLADAVETAGWRNASGGAYKTNPLNPDSDGDGLTDGEEKLFDTNPLSKSSPGLWVEYENNFKTRQYFHPTNNAEPPNVGGGPTPNKLGGGYLHWDEGGRRRILPEAVVVRRGTTFHLHAPLGASITIEKGNPNQSNLSVAPQLCAGNGWDITVDPSETVGIYTAVVTQGDWTDRLPIYVIFELPQPFNGSGFNKITQDDIDRFLYDDDPLDRRDETGVWWLPRETKYEYPCNTHPGQPCDNEPYRTTRSFAQAFTTDQFKKYIFRNRVMPAISGTTDTTTAIDRLARQADDEIRVWYDGLAENSFRALNRYWNGQGYIQGSLTEPTSSQGGWGCDVHANVLSGYGRAAGIMSRPFQADWTSSTAIGGAGAYHGETAAGGWNDNAVLSWVNNDWRVIRAYSTQELNDPYYPWNTDGVHISPTTIQAWGSGSYSDRRSDLITTANSSWQFSDLNTAWPPFNDASDTNGNFAKNWEYFWDSRKPFQILRNPMVLTLNEAFWKNDGWKPNDFSPSVYLLPNPYPGGNLNENWPIDPVAVGCPPTMPNCPFGSSLTAQELPPETPPTDNLTSMRNEMYQAGTKFNDTIRHAAQDSNSDGLADAIGVTLGLATSQPGNYTVAAELFDARGEWIGQATWSGSGANARLQFKQALKQPGPYTLRNIYLMGELGEIYDSRSEISLAPLAATGSPARVGIMPPAGGINARGLAITPTLTFNRTTPDEDDDGKFDALVINAGMTVSQAGNYRLEGWLVAANGELVAWTEGEVKALGVGNQTLSLSFDGRVINDRGLPGPYTLEELKVLDGNKNTHNVLDEVQETNLNFNFNPNQFESTAIFADNMEEGTDNWNWASLWGLSDAISASPIHSWRANAGGFQSGSLTTLSIDTSGYADPVLRFKSCVEASGNTSGLVEVSTTGGTSWTEVGAYAEDSEDWTTKLIDLSALEKSGSLQLRFRADNGALSSLKWHVDDVRLNAWPGISDVFITRKPAGLPTLGSPITFTAHYSTIDSTLPISYTWRVNGQVVGNEPTLVYTFDEKKEYVVKVTVTNPHDNGVGQMVVGFDGTPVTNANFTYSPTPPQVGSTITFTGTHLPLTATNNITHPLTYIWDFGDGITKTGAVVSHSYNAGGGYPVKLRVSNDFGTALKNRTVQVKEPLSAVSFTREPVPAREGENIVFSASYSPTTASKPIKYTWNFGDGSSLRTTQSQMFSHTYTLLGNYTVILTGTNNYGPPVIYKKVISVTGQPVTGANFKVTQTNAANDKMGTFKATYTPAHATNRPPQYPINYSWNFGDGSGTKVTTNPTISHTFPASGTYSVTLTVGNVFGPPVIVKKLVTLPFDNDGDGLSNALEISLGTNPNNSDSDGDGLSDGTEVNGYVYEGYPGHPDYGQVITSDPTDADTDEDGVNDGDEHDQQSHPQDADTDNDGLSDGVEFDPGGSPTTSPIDPDTDGDGIPDATEVGPNFANPRDTDGDGVIDALDADSDGDTIPDSSEWDITQNKSQVDDMCSNISVDTDHDGIPDCQDNDADNDGKPNYRDTDSDEDGAPDKEEGTGDEDKNGILNFLDRGVIKTFMPIITKK